MKKLIFIATLSFLFVSLYSQSWITSNTLSGTEDIVILKATKDSQDNSILFGYFTGTIALSTGEIITSYGGRDLFLSKFDENQNLSWFKRFGGDLNEDLQGGVSTDIDNNIYISSAFQGTLYYTESEFIESTGSFDSFVAKLDANGNIEWIKNSGSGANLQRTTSIKTTNSNELILAGFFLDSINFNNDTTIYSNNNSASYFYSKFSSETGEIIWVKGINSITSFSGGSFYDINFGSDFYIFSGIFRDSIGFENDTLVSIDNSFDAHIIKTDFEGNIQWIRVMQSPLSDFSYKSVIDNEDNIYVTGYYYGIPLAIQSNSNESIEINTNEGGSDYFFLKYDNSGNLIWSKTVGGIGDDKIADAAFFNDEINVSGFFSDSINWGGISLETNGATDQDMFIGSLSVDGNFRSANSFSGRNNSSEDARTIFSNGTDLFTVIRTNTDLLVLGDSIYTNPSEIYFIAVGKIGCLPLSVSPNPMDVIGCKDDTTGSIFISASGGFGSPFGYSIDNGNTYQENDPNFANLAAGTYNVVVIDKENCAEEGGTVTIEEPGELQLSLVSAADITDEAYGEIVVEATGGTTPYIYTLQPTGTQQLSGTFTLEAGEGGAYTVEVQDAHDCGPAVSQSVTIADLTNINNLKLFEGRVYPNPSTGMVTVEFATDRAEMVLQIYSSEGRRVFSKTVYSTGGKVNEAMDLSNFHKGLYMIRIDEKTLSSGVVLK